MRSALTTKALYDWNPITLPTSEVERITQVDRKTMFRWRNRGFLAKSGPRTELYTPEEVVVILALHEMRSILPAFPLEQLAEHARAIAPNILWHALFESKPWQFVGSPKQRLEFDDDMRKEDNKLLELCREILEIPKGDEHHTFSVWNGREWSETSEIKGEDNERGPVLVAIDIFWLGRRFVDRLTGPIYEVRRNSSPAGRR